MYLSIKRTSRSKLYIYACIYWILRFEVLPSSWEMHISVKSTLYELWEKNSLVVVSVVMMHFPANPGGALNTLFIFKRKLRIVLSIAKGRVRTIAISKLSLQSALVRRLLGSQRGNISIRYVSWEVMTHKMEMSAFILFSSAQNYRRWTSRPFSHFSVCIFLSHVRPLTYLTVFTWLKSQPVSVTFKPG